MKVFLGVDGGGTKTEALACSEAGVILGRGITGPSNPIFTGKDEAFEAIQASVESALADCRDGNRHEYFAAICIPGIKRYRAELEQEQLSFCSKLYVDADELNAFYAALAKPYGIVVLGGTGSFAMGINRKGEQAVLGGWGPLLGDEGSGYHIGLLCLKAVIREYEGDGSATALTYKIKEFLNVCDIGELRRKVYSADFDRSSIGNLSRLVEAAAREGDEVSLQIIDEAGFELAKLAKRTARRLGMKDGAYDVVLTGGVANLGELIDKPFTKGIKEEFSNLNVKKPDFKPAVGALFIAMLEADINAYDEKITGNLFHSYKKYI